MNMVQAIVAALLSPGKHFIVESADGGYDVVSYDGWRYSVDGGRTFR